MHIKEIKEMIQLMNENGLSELELEKEGLKIRLKKGPSGGVEPVVWQERARPEVKEPSKSQAAPQKTLIRSPMVGTFYAAPAPDAPSFVQVGSQVEVGQVVCIVEAMKLMNEIKSEYRGRITEIFVDNGDSVEFGQALFALE